MRRVEQAGRHQRHAARPYRNLQGLIRSLEHASEPGSETLAQAAVEFFLEAVAPNEDDLDAPLIDRERLSEARAVLAAVLRWLWLSWLEEAPRPLGRLPLGQA